MLKYEFFALKMGKIDLSIIKNLSCKPSILSFTINIFFPTVSDDTKRAINIIKIGKYEVFYVYHSINGRSFKCHSVNKNTPYRVTK